MAFFDGGALSSIQNEKDAAKVFQKIKGMYKGGTCFILACGPSLTEYSPDEITAFTKNLLVISIKQAFAYAPAASDMLVLNSYNYQRYEFDRRRPLIIRESGPNDPPVFGPSDVVLPIEQHTDPNNQLARRKNFSDYRFDRQLARPWGPGALYEVGFFLALHLGAKEIVTIGWDVGVEGSAVMPHFYEKSEARKTLILAKSRGMSDMRERNRFLHDNGLIYNKPRIIPEEVDACRDVSGDWYDWFAAQGVSLKIVSKNSIADPRIPRLRLEQLEAA
jgi:hypothetical protein